MVTGKNRTQSVPRNVALCYIRLSFTQTPVKTRKHGLRSYAKQITHRLQRKHTVFAKATSPA